MCSAAIQSVMHNIPVIVSACRSSSKNVEPVQNQQVGVYHVLKNSFLVDCIVMR